MNKGKIWSLGVSVILFINLMSHLYYYTFNSIVYSKNQGGGIMFIMLVYLAIFIASMGRNKDITEYINKVFGDKYES